MSSNYHSISPGDNVHLQKMVCCAPKCQKWTTFSLAGVFLLLGALSVIFWDDIVTKIKQHELSLSSDTTKEYKMWVETPIPMYIEFYLYNWTNSAQVAKNWSIKPHLEQLGPYTYSEHHIRKDIHFNNNGTLTYKTERIWHFLPNRSQGLLDDKITTLNVILATIGAFIKDKHPIVKMGVNFFLKEKRINLTVTRTASELLFDGYKDPMLDLLHKLNITAINVPFDKFGWFYSRNESIDYDGTFNMYDGSGDIRQLGRLAQWNFSPTTGIYPGECGKVAGTSGECWYPVEDDAEVSVFSPDTCSTLTLKRQNDLEMWGVKGHRYVGDEEVFDNGTKHPNMACFNTGTGLYSGVRNVSKCKYGAPAFVSYPHFYLADEHYREAVVGMEPNKTLHEFAMAIEPETGIPLSVQAAVQINIQLVNVHRINLLEHVKEIYMPVMWFRQSAELTEDLANQAKLLLKLPAVGKYTGYSFIGISAILALFGGFLIMRLRWKGREELQLLTES